MREKGLNFDLNNIKPDDIEELLKNIADMEVNVKSKNGDTVAYIAGNRCENSIVYEKRT